jgi:8-oxo-dGTP pyrophosphatase MutT (NUDIX family)
MRTVKKITDNKFINIKEVYDPENHCNGYQFAERKGVDSIAFVGYNAKDNKFLLNLEFTPPIGQFLLRAFGGSFDKSKSRDEIVIEEVREEAGYIVTEEQIYPLGYAFVSTQMNQYCYLYLVELTFIKDGERSPENSLEAMAQPTWVSWQQFVNGSDWKAITIFLRGYYAGYIDPRILG